MDKKLKCCAISDTHGYHNDITLDPGDILFHAGDFTMVGRAKELLDFLLWFSNQPYKTKILVAGNHDLSLDYKKRTKKHGVVFEPKLKEAFLTLCSQLNIHYLEHSYIEVQGLRVFGSPYTPSFKDWGFGVDTNEKMEQMFSKLPKNLDVLITHGPPHQILDEAHYQYLGSPAIAEAIFKKKPKVHIFGHIHEGYGMKKFNETLFINASYCGMPYNQFNQPVYFEL